MDVRVDDGELLLAGGGNADDSRLLDERLVKQMGEGGTMGYIPVAMTPERYPGCAEWISSVFDQHGLSNIEMWTSLEEVDSDTVADVSAVYIGGGNTYRLLDELRTTKTDLLLREFVSNGGLLYGGSAGAIICGETIETTPDENHVGLTEYSGIGLIPDVDIWCHYEDAGYAHAYATTSGRTVMAIPERSGVSVTATRYKVVGHEPIRVFQNGDVTEYEPAERFRL